MRYLSVVTIGFLFFSAGPAQAQQPAPAQPSVPVAAAFGSACASCHGPAMTGGSGPSILAYVRYHTDREVTATLRERHANLALSDAQLRELLADMRRLAGTSPLMATQGLTGRRGGNMGPNVPAGNAGMQNAAQADDAPPGGGGQAAAVQAKPFEQDLSTQKPTTIKMANGTTRTGVLASESDLDATLLENGKFVLLTREGDVYKEKALAPKADWSMYDGNHTGNRFSPLEQIDLTTVKRVGPAWIFQMPATPRSLEVTPTVVDGIMYVSGWNEYHALDATTGRKLWSYSVPHTPGILANAGSGANRGVTVSGEGAYFVTDNAHLVGVNRFTGKKLWDVEMGTYADGYSSSSPPLPVGDLLVVGVSGGEEGARGFLDAYRASTGERAWRFYTIPKRGEPGSETWIGQALEHGCGTTWLPGSYDPQLDLVYWAVGNPCPDSNGEERKGDNLWTNSVVALEAKTGKMKWYYQFTPHDTHDWDSVEPMLLVDEMWEGRPRKLLMHGDRNGMFYVLDRVTGEFLKASNLATKVTWVKGFTKEGKPIVDPGSIATKEGVAVCPGSATNWQAASYSPITKLFYVRMADSCNVYASSDDPLGPAGVRWYGRGQPSAQARAALAELLNGYTTGQYIRALDPFTGKKVWDFPAPPGRSGTLTTAGGLTFVGGGGGLLALDAKTGKPVWNVNVNQTTTATPMTFMIGGKQYLALAGSGVVVAYALY